VGLQLRGEGEADVGDGGEGGDDERDGSRHAFLDTGFGPDGAHAHRVLADGDGDAEGGAELHADRLDGGVEVGAFAGNRRRGHPVGGEVYFAEIADLGGGKIGEGFADGEAGGSGGVVDGDGRAFAHGEGFAGVDVEGRGGDAAVGDGDLPGADHLVAADESADGAVADGDEEGFVGDGGVGKDATDGVAKREVAEV